jgi:hypothetical protein
MSYKNVLFILCCSFITLKAGNSVGLNINSQDLEVQTSVDMFSSYEGDTNYVLDGSYLHTQHNNLLRVAFTGENSFENVEGLSMGFGVKTIFTNRFMSLPLFAKANFLLPFENRLPNTSLKTSFAYAPSILNFIDAKTYKEFKLEADMEVISNIHLYTGYRNINTEYKTYNKTFNDSFYGGMKLSF